MPGEYSITAFIEKTLDEEAAARAEAPTTATPVDPRIACPCYKSFDPLIDVERLRSLDVFMAAQIRQHMAREEDYRFFTGSYRLNPKTGERDYVESYSAWFDTVNQFHGSDAHEGLSFSVRVDGVFTHAFRRRIPLPATNRASMPALWAFTGDNA